MRRRVRTERKGKSDLLVPSRRIIPGAISQSSSSKPSLGLRTRACCWCCAAAGTRGSEKTSASESDGSFDEKGGLDAWLLLSSWQALSSGLGGSGSEEEDSARLDTWYVENFYEEIRSLTLVPTKTWSPDPTRDSTRQISLFSSLDAFSSLSSERTDIRALFD